MSLLTCLARPSVCTLSLHDALPILLREHGLARRQLDGRRLFGLAVAGHQGTHEEGGDERARHDSDRKSTRLNSSHLVISYAVFCLKKTNKRVNTSHHLRQAQTRNDP